MNGKLFSFSARLAAPKSLESRESAYNFAIRNTVRRNKVRQAERLPTKRQVRVRIAKRNLEFYGT
jgi:hypothetical protein